MADVPSLPGREPPTQVTDAAREFEDTRVARTLDETKLWFVLEPNGERRGPFSVASLGQQIQRGRVTAQSLVWQEGIPRWVAVKEVFQLLPFLAMPSLPPTGPDEWPTQLSGFPTTEELARRSGKAVGKEASPQIPVLSPVGPPAAIPPGTQGGSSQANSAPRPVGAPAQSSEILEEVPWVTEASVQPFAGLPRLTPLPLILDELSGADLAVTQPIDLTRYRRRAWLMVAAAMLAASVMASMLWLGAHRLGAGKHFASEMKAHFRSSPEEPSVGVDDP
jgi:hypothetical protein